MCLFAYAEYNFEASFIIFFRCKLGLLRIHPEGPSRENSRCAMHDDDDSTTHLVARGATFSLFNDKECRIFAVVAGT